MSTEMMMLNIANDKWCVCSWMMILMIMNLMVIVMIMMDDVIRVLSSILIRHHFRINLHLIPTYCQVCCRLDPFSNGGLHEALLEAKVSYRWNPQRGLGNQQEKMTLKRELTCFIIYPLKRDYFNRT